MNPACSLARLELPDDWSDQTIYRFVAPEATHVSDVTQTLGLRPNMTMVQVDAPSGIEPILASFERDVARFQDPAINSRDPWKHPKYGDVPAFDFSHVFGPGQLIRQISVFLGKPDAKRVLVITMTAVHANFDDAKPAFEKVFRSFELG